ncbi:MAG: PEP-CTERM sorting domain-containing protein [Planctomycetota bacterium]
MLRVITLSVCALPGLTAAQGVTLADIQDEQFFTRFNDTGSNAVGGQAYAPTFEQNPIGSIADFGDVGRVAFIQNGPYYIANPNSWAFAGEGRADILFTTSVDTISLAVRGTEKGDTAGPNGIFPFAGGSPEFDAADGVVWALDINGDFIPGSNIAIENGDLQGSNTVAEINYASADLPSPVWGLAFVQRNDSPYAGLFVGALGVTVPTPASVGLLALGSLAAVRRRR